MAEENKKNTQVSENERSWGQAFEDVAGNTLSAIADGKGVLPTIASGLEAGLNTEQFQEKKNARTRAARLADLQLQQAEANLERTRQSNKHNALIFPEQLEQARQQTKQSQQRTASNDIALQNARLQQQNLWYQQGEEEEKRFKDTIYQKIGYNNLNLYGQAILDNSENLNALADATAIMKAYSRSDEEGDYLLSKTGWKRTATEDGKNILVSPDGKLQFDASDAGLKKIMGDIQSKLKDDIAAGYIMGGDSTSLEQFATKTILEQPGTKNTFGTYGNAVGAYNNFLNGNISVGQGKVAPRFSKEEKLGHLLSRTLQGAIIDGKISQQEMAQLTPLFAMTVKKMGGEVLLGNDVATTKVKLASGVEVPLTKFANDIAQRDTVMTEWNKHCQEVQYNNALKAYKMAKAKAEAENAAGMGEEGKPQSNVTRFTPDKYKEQNKNAYVDLSSDKKMELDNAFSKFNSENSFILQKLPAQDKDLTLEHLPALKLLDHSWNKILDDKDIDSDKFPSPVKNQILNLNINDLHKKALALRKENAELEKANNYEVPKERVEHLPGGGIKIHKSKYTDKYTDNLNKIRELEKQIKELRNQIK